VDKPGNTVALIENYVAGKNVFRLTLMQEPHAIFGYPDFLLKYNKG
jgi:hypothetical protein